MWRWQRYDFDLGSYSRDVTVIADLPNEAHEGKAWFNRGLIWSYAFHREEAVECFKAAVEVNPRFAMAHWGVAYCNGVNYNQGTMHEEMIPCARHAFEYSRRAYALREQCSPVERALIEALQCRYCLPYTPEDTPRLNEDYANAMQRVHEQFPEDVDVSCLYAESLMILRPWKLWDLKTGEPVPRTLEIKQVLEEALAREPNHPGLCHLYIHLMEMSSTPEAALEVAERIGTLAPDCAHLSHMASHIFVQLGMYERCIQANQQAYEADKKYIEKEGHFHFYSTYMAHDLHFVIYSAMMDGQFEVAMHAARELRRNLPDGLVREPFYAQFVEAFVPMDLHVLMRFGKWDEILEQPFPDDREVYKHTTATLHFTRGVAFAALGRINEALEEEQKLLAILENFPESRVLFENTCKAILGVAKEMLRGEIAYRQGDYEHAYESLRNAAELEDSLNYDEPPPWMQPVRHALGALLLEQGRLDEAEEAFRQDMATRGHPENVWSLQGLKLCLQRKGNKEAAAEVERRFEKAAARADTSIHAPCYCARELTGSA